MILDFWRCLRTMSVRGRRLVEHWSVIVRQGRDCIGLAYIMQNRDQRFDHSGISMNRNIFSAMSTCSRVKNGKLSYMVARCILQHFYCQQAHRYLIYTIDQSSTVLTSLD